LCFLLITTLVAGAAMKIERDGKVDTQTLFDNDGIWRFWRATLI